MTTSITSTAAIRMTTACVAPWQPFKDRRSQPSEFIPESIEVDALTAFDQPFSIRTAAGLSSLQVVPRRKSCGGVLT